MRCSRRPPLSSDDVRVETRVYRVELTVTVDDDHEAYDDPERIADAAWGALTNEYGLECTYRPAALVESVQ